MKVILADRYAKWDVTNGFNVLPALQIMLGKGEIDNLDTHRVQEKIEIDIDFSFWFLWSHLYIIIMWGDKGEIEE